MHERHLRAMGSDCHLMVVGGSEALLDRAAERIEELESRWSRFRPDSEVSRLSDHAGEALAVSGDTVLLVERAVAAWRLTASTFDPTVLGDVVRAGYDRSFDDLGAGHDGISDLVIGATDIEVGEGWVRLPHGTGFDPGGIGKGLAADLVCAELVAAGAPGACVNLGGDLRASGAGPEGTPGWTVGVEVPGLDAPLALVAVADGAIATSTTLKRRWTVDGAARHHLIDPRTGEPADTDIVLVTVIAGEAWVAEVLAKAVLIRGGPHPFDLIEAERVEALVVRDGGRIEVSPGFTAFTGGVAVPEVMPRPFPGNAQEGSVPSPP